MSDRLDIPDPATFEQHVDGVDSKVIGPVTQAHQAAEVKGAGNLLDYGIVNMPFAALAFGVAEVATHLIESARDAAQEASIQVKGACDAYQECDSSVAETFNVYISEAGGQ